MTDIENSIKNIFEKGEWYICIYKDLKSKGTFDYTDLINKLNYPSMKIKLSLMLVVLMGFSHNIF